MASLTSLRQSGRHVVGICGALVILEVATHAICGSALELPPDVTCHAIEFGVHARERETGVLEVIEIHSEPVIEVVALIA